jgi:hypothetical protein
MTFDEELLHWRSRATEAAAFFEAKYPEGDFGVAFPTIARRWADALHRDELDPNELRAIISDAERYEWNSAIQFHAFVNSMRDTYNRLWEHYLQTNARIPDTPDGVQI